MPENDRSGAVSQGLTRVGLGDVNPWVFLAHAVLALGAFGLGTVGLLQGAGLGAIPLFGVGLLILILGRYAGRLADRR